MALFVTHFKSKTFIQFDTNFVTIVSIGDENGTEIVGRFCRIWRGKLRQVFGGH